jgi:hypothetical protein
MAQLLGEILVRAKVISSKQLDDAISNQVVYGGRLGTNLMDIGYVNESVLSTYLSMQLGVPTIAPQAYSKVQLSIAKVLPRAIAERTLSVPLLARDKTLHVIMSNPNDLAAQDEIRFATGHKLQIYVAPEVRVYYLLNKLYGTKRDVRYVTLSRTDQMALHSTGAAGGGGVVTAAQPAKVLSAGGVEHAADETLDLMSEEEFMRLNQGAEGPDSAATGEYVAGEVSIGDVGDDDGEILILDDDEAPQPAAAAEAPAPTVAAQSAAAPAAVQEAEVEGQVPLRQLSLAQASKALQHVEDRDQIARVVLGFASATFKRTALFLVKPDMIMGWDGFGGDLNRDKIEQLMIPLAAPSVFKTVFEMQAHFLGAIPKTPVNGRFLKLLGGADPRSAFIIPILFKGKVVNILYGDNGPGADASFDIGELLIVAMKVPQSFEDLIKRKKAAAVSK